MTLLCQPSAWFDAREEHAIAQVLASTQVAGDGVKVRELEGLLRQATGARAVLAVNSRTAALEIRVTPRLDALHARAAKDAARRR